MRDNKSSTSLDIVEYTVEWNTGPKGYDQRLHTLYVNFNISVTVLLPFPSHYKKSQLEETLTDCISNISLMHWDQGHKGQLTADNICFFLMFNWNKASF